MFIDDYWSVILLSHPFLTSLILVSRLLSNNIESIGRVLAFFLCLECFKIRIISSLNAY